MQIHMKILHIISGGDTGGAKTHVINLLKELQKNISVDLICFMDSAFTEEARSQKINLEVFNQRSRLDFFAVKKVIDKIKRENYDVIHCHGARANFISLMIKTHCKNPIVTTIHSDYRLDFQGGLFKRLVYTSVNAVSLRFIDYYIGVSPSFQAMMVSRGFPLDRVFSVYNGIADDDVMCMPRVDFLKKYHIPYTGEEIFVGIMGRLHPVKGHDVFLEAAQTAYKADSRLRFLIAGDGNEEQKIKGLVKKLNLSDVTHLIGFVSNPYDFFNAIDINTLTSHSESFPYVILEGALCKKATISSNVGGIGDLITDGVTGYVFSMDGREVLSSKMVELALSKEKRVKLGEALYHKVKDRFSTSNMAAQHIKIYEEIMRRHASSGGIKDEND